MEAQPARQKALGQFATGVVVACGWGRLYNLSPMSLDSSSNAVAAAPRALWLPAFSLARRELVRFLRQRNRIIGALATPIVFWLLIGAGMGRSFNGSSSGGGG